METFWDKTSTQSTFSYYFLSSNLERETRLWGTWEKGLSDWIPLLQVGPHEEEESSVTGTTILPPQFWHISEGLSCPDDVDIKKQIYLTAVLNRFVISLENHVRP